MEKKKLLKLLFDFILLVFLAVISVKACTGCSSGISNGKYKYTDAIGHEYVLTARSNGTAILKMTSESKGGIDEIAYKSQREGIEGNWVQRSFLTGNNKTNYYLEVNLFNSTLYVCEDGYIYNSYNDMIARNKMAANPWEK